MGIWEAAITMLQSQVLLSFGSGLPNLAKLHPLPLQLEPDNGRGYGLACSDVHFADPPPRSRGIEPVLVLLCYPSDAKTNHFECFDKRNYEPQVIVIWVLTLLMWYIFREDMQHSYKCYPFCKKYERLPNYRKLHTSHCIKYNLN